MEAGANLAVRFTRRLQRLDRRTVKFAAVAALVFYAVAMLWPYLAATLVRGSAVTAWTNVATAPIRGPRSPTTCSIRAA